MPAIAPGKAWRRRVTSSGEERHRGLAGDVVEDDVAQGRADRLEGAAEPGVDALVVRGFQVEGRGEEQALHAGVEGQPGLRGGIGDGGGGDGAVDAAGVDAGAEDGAEAWRPARDGDREALAGGAEQRDAVATVGKYPVGVAYQARQVGAALRRERRDQRRRKSEYRSIRHGSTVDSAATC